MESNTKKSFWQRPEGITGMLFLIPILGLLGWGLMSIMPLVLLATQSAFYSLLFCIGIAVIFFILTSKDIRLAATAFYQVAMRRITGAIIEMDPIAIIKGHLRKLEGNIVEMDESIDTVSGENKKIELKIKKNKDEITHLMERATVSRDEMMKYPPDSVKHVQLKTAFTLDSKQAGRLQASNIKFGEMLNKGRNLESILEKMLTSAKFVLADMTSEVQIQEEEYKIVSASFNAFESARKVIAGDPDQNALYLQSMEFMADDLGKKVGKIERFMKDTGGILTNIDIENEQFAKSGMKMIDDWNSMGEDMFITSPKEALKLGPVNLSNSVLPEAKPDVVLSKSKYR